MTTNKTLLLRRFSSNGDAKAFTKIVEQHAPLVYGVCLRILIDKDKAADAVQITFLQLVRNPANISGSLSSWLHRVATCKAIDMVRSDSQRRQRELRYAADPEKRISEQENATWQEISRYIDEELDKLDDQMREVLILRFFENKTTREIAKKCGISHSTVSRRIDAGITSLRHKLKSRGVLTPAAILTAMLTENMVKAAPALVMKELGKIALAGGYTTATAAGSGILASLAAKATIISISAVIILAVGSAAIYYNSSQQSDAASTWDLVRQSVQNQSQTENNELFALLDQFSQSQENMNSFIIESQQECKYKWENETEKYNGTMYFQNLIAYDGKRNKTTTFHWGNINPIQTNVSENNPYFSASLWDGEKRYSYTGSDSESSSGHVIVSFPGDDEKDIIIQSDYKRHFTGYANGEEERFDELLKENLSQIILREKTENIHGFDCYVIDADINGRGEYHIWIDPEHNYHIVKMQVNRSEYDLSYGNMIEKGYFTKETYEVSSFEKYGDVWFPKEFKETSEKTTYGNPRSDERSFTFTNVVFNPDFEALDTFKPDFIKNGAKVDIIDPIQTPDGKTVSVEGEFTWKDGNIVDNNGHEVDLGNLLPK